MSLFTTVRAICPECDTARDIEVVASLNADRRPDLRQQILDGTFQSLACAACGGQFRIPPSFTYIDFAREQWILAHPASELADWPEFDAQARSIFASAYGPGAPETAREIGRGITARITFGWPALREKLVCTELGLDDVTLELLKLALLRQVQNAPFADTSEMRLFTADDGDLVFGWLLDDSEQNSTSLHVPRAAYDAITADNASWAPLRDELRHHLLVDVASLLVPPPHRPTATA
jgi:hypothetical protein